MPYEEVEIEDMSWSDELQAYTYACPCGDVFQITKVSEEETESGKRSARVCCLACLGLLRAPTQGGLKVTGMPAAG